MDFTDSPAEAEFRSEVREWLREHLPQGWLSDPDPMPSDRDAEVELRRWWQKELYEGGWAGLSWPAEYGGRGASLVEQVIFNQEAAKARAPEPINVIGLYMAGPTIISWGTEEHKKRYLAPLLSGEEIWCQGFSEPGAGSDLAGGRTRAVREGDQYVVNGQKVWTSYAHIADYMILVARTDPDATKHAGLSYFLVDMKQPGVDVRPLVQITGDPEFNETFFDDAVVPADQRLGEEGDGWKVAMTTLGHERGTMAFGLQIQAQRAVDALKELVRKQGVADDPVVREKVARFQVDVDAMRVTNLRALSKLKESGVPGPEGSMPKLMWERIQQGVGEYAMELLGTQSLISEGEHAVRDGYWQYFHLRSRGNTIEAGTTEIQKNIIAERVLGLPRSR